jgi:hypothetical protein
MKGGISLATLDKLPCRLCGSMYKVEMHHIRMIKDFNPKLSTLDVLMAKENRKEIPLCRECHMNVHHRRKLIEV